ncbi:nuclear transport factor 2 family protein [uncultured Aquimarina sp.]|uniref:nuclear transport factor 2 family protein n=1 Tax=uncultured Aquimarina sp. TaxID=575652 RepID=UPI0026029940|nr:nuclear transport factor 2 family protein [uncultured Aquimarina sp.]
MKKVLITFITIITMTITTEVHAQQTDLERIETTLNYYLTGLVNNDAKTLTKAFHPTATMKWIAKDYKEVNAIKGLTEGMDGSPLKEKIKTRVVSVNISGNAASAQLEIQFPTFTYIDFMHVLKIDGQWKIVSKIFHTRQDSK